MRRSSDLSSRRPRIVPGNPARVRVLPTRRGWQVIFVGVSSLGVALSLGTTQFYQLSYALLGLCAASLVLGLSGSRALRLERRISRTEGITAGGSTSIALRLTNGSRLALSGVEVVDRLPERQVFRIPTVPAGGERLSESTVSFPRRGLYEIGPAQVASTDPFGLLRFRRGAGLGAEALVYPEVHDVAGLPARGGEDSGGLIHPMRRGEEISGLREYRPGDDRRFIHWKSVARTGEMVVKEFAPDSPHRYSVVLDLRASHTAVAGREIEEAVSAAASVVSYLDGAGLTYRLRLTDRAASSTGFASGSRTGHGQYHAAMRLLASASADGETETGQVLKEEAAEGRLGETSILIQRLPVRTASPDAFNIFNTFNAFAADLRELSSHGVSVVVVLVASHTYAPQGVGAPGREISEEQEKHLQELAGQIRGAGAAVRVMRRESGLAGLSETRGRERA